MRIRSAVDMRQRPTAALLELDDPYSGWTSHDYRLQEAFTSMQHEKCNRCGNPVWLCHSYDSRIDFEVQVRTCYADAEIKDHEKQHPDELKPGDYYIATAVGIEGEDGEREPLPPRSEAIEAMN